jgi:hypothetical protein
MDTASALSQNAQSQMIPKIGIASYSGKSSVIIDSRFEASLKEYLQEAGLRITAVVPCDRRILGFHWEENEMVPVIDPSLEQTSEVWIKLEDPNHKAGEIVGSWFGERLPVLTTD